jgi:hypothetical protein
MSLYSASGVWNNSHTTLHDLTELP